MLRAVLFDLMDVVIVDPYREAVQAATGLALDQIHVWKDPDCWPDFELGRIDEREFARRFFGAAGVTFDLDAFNLARRGGYRFVAGMPDLLVELGGRVERHVASNYPVWVEEVRQAFDLDRYFEAVWASCYLGVRKPESSFFEHILELTGLRAEECLFVDDRRRNCEGAAAVGLAVHVFDGIEGLRERLAYEGLDIAHRPLGGVTSSSKGLDQVKRRKRG